MQHAFATLVLLALTACTPAADNSDDPRASETAGTSEAADTTITPGLYAVGDETTVYGQTRLDADGTYVDLDGETEVGSGTWRAEGSTMCFDPAGEGEDQQERCWINGPADADGSFLSTRDDGSQSYRVTPVR